MIWEYKMSGMINNSMRCQSLMRTLRSVTPLLNYSNESRDFDPLKMADVIIMNGIKNVISIK